MSRLGSVVACFFCLAQPEAAAAAAWRGAAATLSTVVGAPEVVGGPTCCLFDSPFLALRSAAGTVGLTANGETDVVSRGATVDARLPAPAPTGLTRDADTASYSHCGKWLNAAFVDYGADPTGATVHGFFHQEWHCDYANNEYTNKSVAYARSTDGGLTFAPAPAPDGANPAANQLLAGANTSTAHQTGEGDHGVVRVGDFLYMFALNWDGDGGSRTVPIVARSRVADGGVPGTWLKLYGGAWSEPGVGGRADAQSALPGTAAYTLPAVSPTTVLAVGVIFSASLEAAWADGTGADGAPTDFAPAAAGPLFHAGASSWDRHANSSELFGYPGLTSLEGSADGSVTANSSFVYFTYLVPGGTFADRWLVRRPLHIFERADGGGAPPALSALSLWATTTAPAPRWWAAGGPVAPDSAPGNYSAVGALGALLTAPSTGALALYECMLAPGAVALTLDGECGAGGTLGGALLRSPGWLAPSAAAAAALGWSSVRYAGGGAAAAATPAPLWRCIGAGPANFSAATDAACAGAGPAFAPHRELGWVLVGLPAT